MKSKILDVSGCQFGRESVSVFIHVFLIFLLLLRRVLCYLLLILSSLSQVPGPSRKSGRVLGFAAVYRHHWHEYVALLALSSLFSFLTAAMPQIKLLNNM